MKRVIDGVYETNKMKVEIGENLVSKTFKNVGRNTKRYELEKTSLQRLAGLPHFPELIFFDDKNTQLKMSRLPGSQPDSLSETQIQLLQKMVHSLYQAGVARHAIPMRDLLCRNDQELNMVDFERVTLKNFGLSPVWLIAKKVSDYHLCRLIRDYQPHLLSKSEKRFLKIAEKLRNIQEKFRPLKNMLKSLVNLKD